MNKTENMNNDVSFEEVVAEIGTLNPSQIAELKENVKDKPSTAHTLEVTLRTVGIAKLIDALDGLEPFAREGAFKFAVKALTLIGDMRSDGKSDTEIFDNLEKFVREYK